MADSGATDKRVAWWKHPNLLMTNAQLVESGLAPSCIRGSDPQLRLWINGVLRVVRGDE